MLNKHVWWLAREGASHAIPKTYGNNTTHLRNKQLSNLSKQKSCSWYICTRWGKTSGLTNWVGQLPRECREAKGLKHLLTGSLLRIKSLPLCLLQGGVPFTCVVWNAWVESITIYIFHETKGVKTVWPHLYIVSSAFNSLKLFFFWVLSCRACWKISW